MMRKLRVTVEGKAYDVTVEFTDEGEPRADIPAAEPPAQVTPASVKPVPLPPALKQVAHSGPDDIASPLAGHIQAVHVVAGQDVKEGDHLITLEAMKMYTFIYAPRDGRVKEVKVTVGITVEEGQPLASLD